MTEVWKDITGYEGSYQVSDQGRVKSLARTVPHRNSSIQIQEKILEPGLSSDGRHSVTLYRDGVKSTKFIHQLTLKAFVGPCPEGMEVCHQNGDHVDNRLSNLRYDTAKNNQQDRIGHGTDNHGARNGRSKLTEQAILEIRDKYATGMFSQRELGNEYGVSQAHIGYVVNKKSWAHV